MSIRVLYRYIVYLFVIIIPIICGFFGGMFQEIISAGGNWDGIMGIIARGHFGNIINGLIGFFLATLIVRAVLAFLINTSSFKDIISNNILSEWNYPAWVLSFIIGVVICGAIVSNFKILIGIIIGFIVGIIVDAIIFGLILTIINIDCNLAYISINIDLNLQGINNNLKEIIFFRKKIKETNSNDLKKCPFCAEQIKREAKICRFCNREVRTEI